MTKNPATLHKGEDEILDFEIDMTHEFADRNDDGSDDVLASVSWVLSDLGASLSVEDQSNTSSTATIWLSGGQHGIKYQVTAIMTTTGGRIYDRYFNLFIA